MGWPEQGRHILLKKGRKLDAKKAVEPTGLTQEAKKEEEEEEEDNSVVFNLVQEV